MKADDLPAPWATTVFSTVVEDALGPAKDQGQRGTCLAFATTRAHEAVRGEDVELCTEFLFWAAKEHGGLPTDHGTTIPAISRALETDGQPEESFWPYDPDRDDTATGYGPPSPPMIVYKWKSASSISVAGEIREALEAGTPPVLGLALTESFFFVKDEALDVDGSPQHPAWHAVLAVGYGELEGAEVFLIRNSWGAAWGVRGYGLISPDYLDAQVVGVLVLEKDGTS